MQDHPGTAQALREFYHERRVMITGGLGFIGWNLAERLYGLGARVLVARVLAACFDGGDEPRQCQAIAGDQAGGELVRGGRARQ